MTIYYVIIYLLLFFCPFTVVFYGAPLLAKNFLKLKKSKKEGERIEKMFEAWKKTHAIIWVMGVVWLGLMAWYKLVILGGIW